MYVNVFVSLFQGSSKFGIFSVTQLSCPQKVPENIFDSSVDDGKLNNILFLFYQNKYKIN